MKNKLAFSLLIALFIGTVPFLASADTVSDLRAQLQSVLNQIEELKNELTLVESGIVTTVGGGSSCVTIEKNLRKGQTNTEVTKLQLFLAQDSNIYPEAITSGYFGTLTERAVQKWQARHGVISYGTPASTGYGAVGPKTRRAIENACGDTSSNVAGTDNVISFTFKTTSGQAPFNSAIDLTMLEGACMSYEISWGDGSPSTKHTAAQTSNCGGGIQSIVEQHTYSLAGEYTAVLYAGKGNVETLPQVTLSNVTILTGEPFVKVVSPNGGETLRLGDNTTIKWQVANQPQDSAIVFYVVGPTGTYRFAKRSHRSAEFNWIVGDRVCDGNGCNVQLPLGGNYKIRAVMYTPADACIDFCNAESITPKFLVNDESDEAFSLSQLGAGGTSPLLLPQKSGKAPFTTSMSIRLEPVTGGAGNFEVDFGDGSVPHRVHVPAGETRATERIVSHTYANAGDYLIRLRPVGAVQHMAEERITVTDPEFRVLPKTQAYAPVTAKALFKVDSACSHNETLTRTYTVDWGDNTETSRFEAYASKCVGSAAGVQALTDKSFTHAYTEPGTYHPELTISVNNIFNKRVTDLTLERLDLSVSPTFGFSPLNVNARFTADESCAMGAATTVTYSIDWGDGTAKYDSTQALAACGDTFSLNTLDRSFAHTYQEIGRYTVTLTARKGNIGASYSRSREVVVDKSVIRNGSRKFAKILDNLNVGENMAAGIRALFAK